MYGSDMLIDAIRSGLVALPRSKDDLNELEAQVAAVTVHRCTVDQNPSPPPDRSEIINALRQRDLALKQKRKLEQATKATDRERALAKALAEEQAERAKIQTRLDAMAAGSADEAMQKLLAPQVVIRQDPVAARELEHTKKALAEALETVEKQRHVVDQYQREVVDANRKRHNLEDDVRKMGDVNFRFQAFAAEVAGFKRSCAVIAVALRHRRDLAVDLELEQACADVIRQLTEIVETMRNARALPSAGRPAPIAIARDG